MDGEKTFIKVNTGSTTAVIHYLYVIPQIYIAQLNIYINKQFVCMLYLVQSFKLCNLWMRHSRGVHSSTTRVTYTMSPSMSLPLNHHQKGWCDTYRDFCDFVSLPKNGKRWASAPYQTCWGCKESDITQVKFIYERF